MVGNLGMYFGVVNTFLGALMPAISESYGNKRQKLTEYYLIEGIKWSYYFTFFLTAVLLATGNSIIVLAGTQWSPALKDVAIYMSFCGFLADGLVC